MKTKLYHKALKLYYKWFCPMTLHTSFWIPIWDDVLFWFNNRCVWYFTNGAVEEFNYVKSTLELHEKDDFAHSDFEFNSWRKFLEDNKRYRRRYWDADAVLKRAVAGEGDLERQ